jgi:hypothetical protein
MTKSQVDKLAKWQVDKMTKSQVDKLAKWQVDKMTKSQVDKLTKWQADKMASWRNDQAPNDGRLQQQKNLQQQRDYAAVGNTIWEGS